MIKICEGLSWGRGINLSVIIGEVGGSSGVGRQRERVGKIFFLTPCQKKSLQSEGTDNRKAAYGRGEPTAWDLLFSMISCREAACKKLWPSNTFTMTSEVPTH